MGGTWNPSPPPIRPGFYLNFETAGAAAVAPGNSGIVGIPITSDWGPVEEFVLLSSDGLYKKTYGPNNLHTSYLVQEAFRGGASQVLAYRVYDGTPAAGTSVLDLYDETASGTVTIAEIQDGGGGNDEEQTVLVSATAGTFTLTFDDGSTSETTAAIAWNASAADIDTALTALPNVGLAGGTIAVSGGPVNSVAVSVTFGGTLANTSFDDMTYDDSNLFSGNDIVVNLTAKYPGTRGDDLRIVVEDNPLASLSNPKTDVKVYENNILREKFTYPDLDHTRLVEMLNDVEDGSDLIIGTLDTGHPEYPGPYTGKLNRDTTGTFMAGGDDGVSSPMPISIWTDALDAFERQGGFDLFTLPDVHDNDYVTPGIIAALVDWTNSMNDRGQYVLTVIGGDIGEDITEAISRSEGADSEWIVNVGRTDLLVTYPANTVPGQDSEGRVLRRTAAMTARIAGLIGGAGVARAITFNNVAATDSDVSIQTPMTLDEIEEAITSGVVIFTKRGPRVVVEDGVTSFTDYSDEKDATFGNIKAVRTMQKVGRDFTEIIETGFIGQQNNTAATRSSLLTLVSGYLHNLETQGALVQGSEVQLDDRFDNTKENIHLLLLVQFSRELKRVLMTLRAPLL